MEGKEINQITEVTFEVTVRHFVADDSPNPDATRDVARSLEDALIGRGFDVWSVTAERICMTHPLDLREGDLVDLEGDPYADPTRDTHSFEYLYFEVAGVVQETPECVRVDFYDWDSCGFPIGHELRKMGHV